MEMLGAHDAGNFSATYEHKSRAPQHRPARTVLDGSSGKWMCMSMHMSHPPVSGG